MKNNLPDFNTYLSPFTWRYASPEMRRIWSEENKRLLWRKIWVVLAEVQAEFGLVRPEQVADLRMHQEAVDLPRALEIEAEIHHDLMAELRTFAEQSLVGGGILHLGATSTDIEDNVDVLRIRASLDLLIPCLQNLLRLFSNRINAWAEEPLIAFTHLQPAEPSTLGYRLANYAQDLIMDWENLRRARAHLRGKGFRGAVGTGASYVELLGVDHVDEFDTRLSARLGLPFFPVTTQVYPRKQDFAVVNALAGLGSSVYKFAFDLRFLQSPPVGELAEPFGQSQVGSSAMPFKRNPIQAEKVDSLARQLAQAPRLAWDNAAHSLLERTLDDSANRRTLLPEAFLIADELVGVTTRIVNGLEVNKFALARNFAAYAPFAATERLLMAMVKAGADRQAMHEHLRKHSLVAWDSIQGGKPNPLADELAADAELQAFLSPEDIRSLMDARRYLGDAAQRAHRFAADLNQVLESFPE